MRRALQTARLRPRAKREFKGGLGASDPPTSSWLGLSRPSTSYFLRVAKTWMAGTSPRVSGTVCAFMPPSPSLHKHDLLCGSEPLGWRTVRSQRCSVVASVLAVTMVPVGRRLVVDA
jgi:hypothetical protein